MSQPEWEVFRSLGDRGIVLVDKTGIYGPEAEIWETYECERGCSREDHKHAEAKAKAEADEMWDESRNRTLVFRFEIERFSLYREEIDADSYAYREMLIPFGFDKRTDLPHPISSYKQWFSDDLASVASSAGTTREELVEGLCSEDIMARLWALECIAGHHGYENFDGYPLDLSVEEMARREECQPPKHPDYK
jgi:hypothetical protein